MSLMPSHEIPLDLPPYYEDLEELEVSSPVYSSVPGSSERLILYEPLTPRGCQACDWIFSTRHMSVSMGSRAWGLPAPSYGLNGIIKGIIKIPGDGEYVRRLTVTLEGSIVGIIKQGSGLGESKLPIISRTVTLYATHPGSTVPWANRIEFSIPIPTDINLKSGALPLPPSYTAHHQTLSCTVDYVLKIEMTRRHSLWRRESICIPILYLPKSRPREPPLSTIPRPPSEPLRNPPPLYVRVKAVDLSAFWPHKSPKRLSLDTSSLRGFSNSVYLSLPSPQCYTSGTCIPFTLSLVFPRSPFIPNLLSRDIQIVLVKRLRVWRQALHVANQDTIVSTAKIHYSGEYTEGVTFLRGTILAGAAGRENSWRVDGVAEAQYVLRITLRPSETVMDHVPSFYHEEPVQITTDFWDTMERELVSSGGTPTPALGLASCLLNGNI